jgi:hypothetical protein
MKTLNLPVLAIAVMMVFFAMSCKKEITMSSYTGEGLGGGSVEIAQVTASEWFYVNWGSSAGIKSAYEITADIWKNGKVLVFGKGGYEMRSATALPAAFDANYIGIDKRIGSLKFVIEGTGAISPSLEFRYILIPASKLIPYSGFDYNNYKAVCTCYDIPE